MKGPVSSTSSPYLVTALCMLLGPLLFAFPCAAQTPRPQTAQDLQDLGDFPAIPGYAQRLTLYLRSNLEQFHPASDNLGDVLVTIGSGAPHRLIAAPVDQPGFVVSEITEDGYLRLQRLPPTGLPAIFNEIYSTQSVTVGTTSGAWINGVVVGLSIHLLPDRVNPPKVSDMDNLYVDIGAASAVEVRKAGVDILSPVATRPGVDSRNGLATNRAFWDLAGGRMAGSGIGDVFGAAALLEVLHRVDASKIKGTVTFAFVTQQWTAARGLQRVLTAVPVDEMVYVGRLLPGGPVPGVEGVRRAPRREPGNGVLLGLQETNGIPAGLASELKQIADQNKIPFVTDFSAPIRARNYSDPAPFPPKWVHLGIGLDWVDTPAEILDWHDLVNLENLLDAYVEGVVSPPREQTAFRNGSAADWVRPETAPANTAVLGDLVRSYGPSNHELTVRDAIAKMLPSWAKPETDGAGNLILHAGNSAPASRTPPIMFVAHMDEIGFEVKNIADDGRLEVAPLGGMDLSYYLGHPALVHSANGDHPAIMELPDRWDEPTFHWPPWTAMPERAIRVDVGARSRQDAEKLGAKVGDTVTIPKAYRPLIGTRADGRSFDDRVGCTALISAVWALGGPLKDRDVTFVWSTGEELGLNGAAALAARLAKEGHEPAYVFAIDTFVSSDSPLESKRFADAEIGKGFVVRAVDDSNITPRDLVDRVVKLARANQVPVQYGATGGGNDGSAFLRYGSIDIPLGWPLRYSHSPGEVIDTRDVDALARIVTLLAKTWSN